MKIIWQSLPAILICFLLLACGGSSGRVSPPGATPHIESISPNSSKLSGPGFTLSVVGTNFVAGATIHWNTSSVSTSLLSSNLLTAEVPSSVLSASGPVAITVANPSPGGVSNSLSFALPCVIDPPTPASQQTRARLGAYFFDGWTGPLTNFHYQGLPLGPYQDREPLSGWEDNTTCAVEQQLAWAHNSGIDFFVFDWYFNAQAAEPDENLNSALQITQSLADRHGMQYAILYVDAPPFVVGPADWTAVVNEWVGYMTDPDYVRVNGKPLLVVYDMDRMRQTFGSSTAVADAFSQLQAAAVAKGLPGVYITGAAFGSYDHNTQSGSFQDLSMMVGEGYDAATMYNYAFGTVSGEQPFAVLSEAGHGMWDQAVLDSPVPFIPIVMDGRDARPWAENDVWFTRSPQDVTALVSDAIAWANSNPQLRPEPSPAPPLVLTEAWNELGEGSYLVPTVGDGTSYGDALASMLTQ